MGTPIQEPNQIDESHVTDENAGNIALVAYEKSPDGAGLKTLGLAKWKQFMNYNGFKVDNIAKLSGFVKADYDKDYEIDPPAKTLKSRIDAIQTNTGVIDEISDPPATPLSSRIGTIETTVGEHGSGGTGGTGLCQMVDTNTSEISDLWSTIGGGSTPSPGGDISQRLSAAEGNIQQLQGEVETPVTGLIDVVGDSSHGLVKDVSDLKNTVGDSSSGLVKRTTDLETTINTPTTGLSDRTSELETIVGDAATPGTYDSGTGLQKDVNNLQMDVSDIKSKISAAYVVKGDVNQSKADSWSGSPTTSFATFDTGFVWNVNSSPNDAITILIPTSSGTNPFTVDNGVNIVWIKKDDLDVSEQAIYTYGKFDKLSNTVTDERVTELVTDVSRLKNIVENPTTGLIKQVGDLQQQNWCHEGVRKSSGSGRWSSADEDEEVMTGIFQISGRNSSNELISCIIYLNEGKCYTPTQDIITMSASGSSSYTTLFRVNDTALTGDNTIEVVGSAQTFNIRRIGGVN